MHREILTAEQEKLLPLVKKFSSEFGLVGGTAVALHLGHRRSIDFDLFTAAHFNIPAIQSKITRSGSVQKVLVKRKGEFTLLIDSVKFTFFEYPFPTPFSEQFENIIRIPDLLTLGAMKAYALGRRAKWKDYVDLYFIAKKYDGLERIAEQGRKIFGGEFNEKIFRVQLAYFEDIDYGESVEFMEGCAVPDAVIREGLIRFCIS